ncbi:hypothetical protein CASFOL_039106 [Castilleja foliolosa]|uniref:LAGLIDADG homing endonuclease n=1 Tax=Castilleja foliolosa TaxID=1961234 RepID=A0ABD3BIV9_9LAMI
MSGANRNDHNFNGVTQNGLWRYWVMQLLQEPSVNLRFYVLRPISGSGPHQSFQKKTEEDSRSKTEDMELKKRNMSSSNLYSDVMDPKRRATPSEDSPIAQIFNDVGIHDLVREVKSYSYLVENGKEFLISLRGITKNSPEESVNKIYVYARQIWEFQLKLVNSCFYAIEGDSSLARKLVFYSNKKTAVERVNSMMEDPWLEYILGNRILGDRIKGPKKYDLVRAFLSIFIAYWNMEDIIIEHELGTYRPLPNETYQDNQKIDEVIYVIEHVEDFQNLKEVVYSKYGSDPNLAANLFEKLKKYQVERMDLRNTWTSGKRARIEVPLVSEGSNPPTTCGVFAVRGLNK